MFCVVFATQFEVKENKGYLKFLCQLVTSIEGDFRNSALVFVGCNSLLISFFSVLCFRASYNDK